ncbi:MAG TPA: hypothetical protein VHU81_07935, partial [Thermoanaerobaculia bacterium]|nr:hypothetical protein [Thermoanaerobaculia bacterium]
MIADRISRFVQDPQSTAQSDLFGELALEAFAFQYEHIAPYRRLCDRRGATPGAVADWRDVPPVPTAAFKTLRLSVAPEGQETPELFRSSGTTGTGDTAGGGRSVHHCAYPDLYRQV